MSDIKIPQFDNPNLEPISGMDATFLYLERHNSPMHVGSVGIIEGSLKFETFRKVVASRLHQIPKLRKKLVYVPLSVDYPYWADDPDFDIDLHIDHIALPQPGDWKQLRKIASKIFSQPLNPNRPLWSFTFVEGLDDVSQVAKGSVALISKIHHVAIDGVAGAGILSILFDMSPDLKDIPDPKPYNPNPLPNELSLIANSVMSFAKNPLKFPRLIKDTIAATVKTGMLNQTNKMELPAAPFSAPNTPLNGIVSARRRWNSNILSLARIKKLKNIMGTTMNDVMLAICSGALRRYLDEKGKLPLKPLVAMVPISTRTKSEENNQGNQISSMLVQLATDIADPIERLEEIHENTTRGKTYQSALGAKTLSNMAEAVPYGIANQAARIYSRFQMAEMHNPVFNVTITNVPGPPFPLYVAGHKLLSINGMAPILDGMGLIITIFSYDGKVMVSPTSDAKSMPDLNLFNTYIRESANELETLILEYEKSGTKKKKKTPVKAKAKSDALFAHIKKYLKANPDKIRPNSGLFQFNVIGDTETFWKVDFNKSPADIRRGKATEPDATFTVKDDHLYKIGTGQLNIQTAFIQGRLKIHGDSGKAMKLGGLLMKMDKMAV